MVSILVRSRNLERFVRTARNDYEAIDLDRKEFNSDDYLENDSVAKKTVIDFLKEIYNYEVVSTTENFDFDILARDAFGNKIRVEAERKKVWESVIFPYPTIDVPCRKGKNTAHLFVMCNNRCNSLLVVDMIVVKSSPVERKDTKCKYQNTFQEKFFKVSLDHALFFEKKDGSWKRLWI